MANIKGDDDNNQIRDKKSNDKLFGFGGEDLFLMVDGGKDVVDGGDAFDVVSYHSRNKSAIVVNFAKGTVTDGKGVVDTFVNVEGVDGTEFADRMTGAVGGNSFMGGRDGDDVLVGKAAASGWNSFRGGQGNDKITGGAGWNILQYDDDGFNVFGPISQGIEVDLKAGRAVDGWGDLDTLKGVFREVEGTHLDDTMSGDEFGNRLEGQDGDDTLHGGADVSIDNMRNWDELFGEGGKDSLTLVHGFAMGGEGADSIVGLTNRAGNVDLEYSVAGYQDAPSGIVANLTNTKKAGLGKGNASKGFKVKDGHGDVDTIKGLKAVADSAHNDVFFVNGAWTNGYGTWIEIQLSAGNDKVQFKGMDVGRVAYGNAQGPVRIDMQKGTGKDHGAGSAIGNDTFTGANEARGSNFDDLILGKNGDDKRLRGHNGADELRGRGGKDQLEGEGGDDRLFGDDGDDLLIGGHGADELGGGLGADRFAFRALTDSTVDPAGQDTILDFNRAHGDKFDVSTADINPSKAGRQPLKFIGDKAFSNKAGEMRFEKGDENTMIEIDFNGDGTADAAALIVGLHDLVKNDFLI